MRERVLEPKLTSIGRSQTLVKSFEEPNGILGSSGLVLCEVYNRASNFRLVRTQYDVTIGPLKGRRL